MLFLDVLIGNIGTDESLLRSIISGSFLSGNVELFVFLLTLGPFLTLLTRPFEFVEIWLNQGLYEFIGSKWDTDTYNENLKKYNRFFPSPLYSYGFINSLFFSSSLILLFLTLSAVISLTPASLFPFLPFIAESLLLAFIVSSFIYIVSLIALLYDLMEEKVLWIFAREGRNSNPQRNMINWSLYGMYLLIRRYDMTTFLSDNPERWGFGWFLKGLLVYYDNDYETEINYYNTALDPEKVLLPSVIREVYNNRANDYINLGYYEEAIKDLTKIIDSDSSFAPAYANRGVAHKKLGMNEEAIKDYSKAVKLNPDDSMSYYNRGHVYIDMEQYELALKDYNQTLAMAIKMEQNKLALTDYNQTLALAIGGKGNAYLMMENYEEAIIEYKKAIELDSTYSTAYNNLGITYMRLKRYEEAKKYYNLLLEHNPDHAGALYDLACIYALGKDVRRTISYLERAFSLKTSLISHSVTDEDLAAVRSNTEFQEFMAKYLP